MSRSLRIIATFLLLAFPSSRGALRAEDNSIEKKIDTERISLDFKNKPLVNVLQLYATLLKVEIHFQSCDAQHPISIMMDKVSMRTSLNALAESAGLKWSVKESGGKSSLVIECQNPSKSFESRILNPASRSMVQGAGMAMSYTKFDPYSTLVNIEIQKSDLREVLNLIAKSFNLQLLIDGDLPGRLANINIKNMYFTRFLDTVCAQLGAKWKIADSNPKLLIIEKASKK
jgi:hypothetical protein